MAPPSILSFFENLETSPRSMMLSPFPSFSQCCGPSIIPDPSYVIDLKNGVNDEGTKLSPVMSFQDCIDDFGNEPDSLKLHTPSDDEKVAFTFGQSSPNSGTDDENAICNVSLVNSQSSVDTNDADFLQGLDDLDFHFNDMELLHRDTSEGSFQNFVKSQLDDSLNVDSNNNNNNNNNNSSILGNSNDNEGTDTEGDIYRKAFFMKHLRLQRVSCPKTTQRKNRKRKLEESSSTESFSEIENNNCLVNNNYSINSNDCRRNESPLNSPCDHLSHLLSPCSFSFNKFLSAPNQSFLHNSIMKNSPLNLHHCSFNKANLCNNSNRNNETNNIHHHGNIVSCSFSSTFHQTPSIPFKSCSCSSVDWKSRIVYTTASSSQIASVQTSPSTASSAHMKKCMSSSQNLSPNVFFEDLGSGFPRNNECLSPLMILSEGLKEFEFDLMDRGEIDEETEDLLKWLDTQQKDNSLPLSIVGKAAMKDEYSRGFENNEISFEIEQCLSSPSDSSNPYTHELKRDDMDTILSPESHHFNTSMEMESFVNLESYVTEHPVIESESSASLFSKLISPGSVCKTSGECDILLKSHIHPSILKDLTNDKISAELNKKKDSILQENEGKLQMLDLFSDENAIWCF